MPDPTKVLLTGLTEGFCALQAVASPDQLGLVGLIGIVVAPRPFRDWREKPNAGGERRR
jgi:hypothetical protein